MIQCFKWKYLLLFYLTTETESIKSVGVIHEEGAARENVQLKLKVKTKGNHLRSELVKKEEKKITAVSSYFVSATNKK